MNVHQLNPNELSIIEIDVDITLPQVKVREILNEYTKKIEAAGTNIGRTYSVVCVPRRT